MSYTLKRGNTSPPVEATLRQASKKPIELFGYTVEFLMRPAIPDASALTDDITETVLTAPAQIVDAKGGKVVYQWVAGDTDVAGIYYAEFRLTLPDGGTRTVPSDGYIDVQILADLA